jgi:hypothetical protein
MISYEQPYLNTKNRAHMWVYTIEVITVHCIRGF